MYQIKWTRPALDTLSIIQNYIAEDSPKNAVKFITRIFDAVEKLNQFPERGRRVPEALEYQDVRELLFNDYRIIYRIKEKQIDILTVIHGSKNMGKLHNLF